MLLIASLALTIDGAFAAVACAAGSKFGLPIRFLHPLSIGTLAAALACQTAVACVRSDIASALPAIVGIAAVAVSAVTDAQTGYILDLVTIPALAAVLLFSFAAGTSASAFGGATAASVALGSVYAITLGRGLGLGDVKLAACIGAVLGARDALTALGVAFIAGGIYAGFVLITRRGRRGDAVHFAPYLAGGTLMMSLYGIVR